MADNTKLQATFTKLDSKNDGHWMPNGEPRLDVVRKLASDNSIKLVDIQATGYVRPSAAPKEDAEFKVPADQAEPKASTETGLTPAAQADGGTTLAAEPPVEGQEVTDEEWYAILEQRVNDGKIAVEAARTKQQEGAKEEAAAIKALNAAKVEFAREFPPMTAADNVKEYIASENAKRAARVENRMAPARVDMAMGRGNNRGWRRPVRGIVGPDGNLIKNADGTVTMPTQMQVRPRQVIPSMGTRPSAGAVQRA